MLIGKLFKVLGFGILMKEVRPIMIGICGPSTSGKSSLANALKKELAADVIEADNFLKRLPKRQVNGYTSWEHPSSMLLKDFKKSLKDIKKGKRMFIPSKKLTEIFDKPISPKKFIIVEGFLLFHSKSFSDMFDLKFFLDIPLDKVTERRVDYCGETERDYSERVVIPEHLKYRKEMIRISDYILDGNKSKKELLKESFSVIKSKFIDRVKIKKIGLDFDGPVVDTGKLQQLILRKHGYKVPPTCRYSNIPTSANLSREEYNRITSIALENEKSIPYLELQKNFKRKLKELLSQGHSVEIITARAGEELKFAKKYLKYNNIDILIHSSGDKNSKVDACRDLDIYIEDMPFEIKELKRSMPRLVLFNTYDNKSSVLNKDELRIVSGVERISDWKDFNLS